MTAEHWARVEGLSYFQKATREGAALTTLLALPAIQSLGTASPIDWTHPLFAASLVDASAPASLQDSSLRVVQACLQDPAASDGQKDAARILLEGWGNARAIALAREKDLVGPESVSEPWPVQLDLIRQRFELTIHTGESEIHSNSFQRRFWGAVQQHRWVSVSAPTSVGKSFIVRKWIQTALLGAVHFTAIYVVPTRALIDEVTKDLVTELPSDVDVFSLPWDSRITSSTKRVFVLTQERLHLLHDRMPNLTADLLFIDEAQKFDDGRRGMLLQRELDEAAVRSEHIQVIFASPLAENPELLVSSAPSTSETILSELVTVNQNLIYVNQRYRAPMTWDAELVVAGVASPIGSFQLPFRPNSVSKRLAYVAVALGGTAANVVYVNGASEAEKVANNIFECLPANDSQDEALVDLMELVEKTIHPQYALRRTLARGVAFHYGNMPLLVREEIERLFRDGVIRYLVCTSTLLEGVNLPCQNIFVRGPKKGNNHPMAPSDFWNLAGRAGRWGKEFQGTIVCVDTSQAGTWASVPRLRERAPIVRATDSVLDEVDKLVAYINAGGTLTDSRKAPELEAMFSLIAASHDPRNDLAGARWMTLDATQLDGLVSALEEAMRGVSLERDVVRRHAGISPLSLQRLYEYFLSHDDPERLPISPPESDDAALTLVAALSRIDDHLGGDFSSFGGRRWQLAILLVSWMRGKPLSVLIAERVEHFKGKKSMASVIRSVLADVEQIARFQAPLYLAAYLEILGIAHVQFTQDEGGFPDISMMLELGVSRTTELSMMSLGVSRTAAVALSEYIVEDSLSPAACIAWLLSHDLESLGLPVLVVKEYFQLVETLN